MKSKRLLATLLTICMVLTMLPVSALAEDSVTYWDPVAGETKTATTTTTDIATGADLAMTDGKWYYVPDDATITNRITVMGNVNLILGDGATLTASEGITVQGSANSLTIWAQSTDPAAMGKLTATADSDAAGIGGSGSIGGDGGNITINGGVVTASSSIGAGIGGGATASTGGNNAGDGGTITINGGVVTASSNSGAGIGGGYGGGVSGSGGNITINGGVVTASSNSGAAIGGGGGGVSGSGGNITINGGFITAEATYGAGIGGGGSTYGSLFTKTTFLHRDFPQGSPR